MQPPYKTAEVAVKLNMSERWVLANARRLGGKRRGTAWRFPVKEIERAEREDIVTKGPGRPRRIK